MVQVFIERYSRPGEFQLSRPYIPFYIQIFVKQNADSKIHYSNFIKHKSEVARSCETRWNARLGTVLSKENWSQIYKICFTTTTDNASIWFQYKLIYNILATQSCLFNLKITDPSTCAYVTIVLRECCVL